MLKSANIVSARFPSVTLVMGAIASLFHATRRIARLFHLAHGDVSHSWSMSGVRDRMLALDYKLRSGPSAHEEEAE